MSYTIIILTFQTSVQPHFKVLESWVYKFDGCRDTCTQTLNPEAFVAQ